MIEPTHTPYGLMCCACTKAEAKCNHLDFTKMKVLFKEDGYKVVKCTDFESKKN